MCAKICLQYNIFRLVSGVPLQHLLLPTRMERYYEASLHRGKHDDLQRTLYGAH
jgi:hypothetical protein